MNANDVKYKDGPRWSQLYETAATQEGHFTTAQAAEAGYYPQLLTKYLKNGRFIRALRGIYRLVHFPPGDHENLVVIWLWSDRVGVFSHETALTLHQLSDAMPSEIHLTLPISWKSRRLKVPAGVALHFASIDNADRTWAGAVRLTTPVRTVIDCAAAGVTPALVQQAINEGLMRGLFTESMIKSARDYLREFGAGGQ